MKRKSSIVRASTDHYKKSSKKFPLSGQVILLIVLVLLLIIVAFFADDIHKEATEGAYPQTYSMYVTKYAEKYNVPQYMIYAVIRTESKFDSNAVSGVGAVGLMQLMPETFTWISNDLLGERLPASMAYDPETNIRYGTYLLSRLYSRYGDWNATLAAYNAGPGRVDGWLKDSRYVDANGKLLPSEIPIDETRNYVAKVQKSAEEYRQLYETVSQ